MKGLKEFAELLEKEQIEDLHRRKMACPANISNCRVSVKSGNKYTKVDVGGSGKYMVDKQGNIFGIKAYGVIHKGHFFGALDTIDDYSWGGFRGVKKSVVKKII